MSVIVCVSGCECVFLWFCVCGSALQWCAVDVSLWLCAVDVSLWLFVIVSSQLCLWLCLCSCVRGYALVVVCLVVSCGCASWLCVVDVSLWVKQTRTSRSTISKTIAHKSALGQRGALGNMFAYKVSDGPHDP